MILYCIIITSILLLFIIKDGVRLYLRFFGRADGQAKKQLDDEIKAAKDAREKSNNLRGDVMDILNRG